jgi:2-methylisocitrate lyase-like PEP mutase family enzyme
VEPSVLRQRAETLRALHNRKKLLVLPNVWDAISARLVERAGFPAVATGSSAVAAVLGYPDGQHISRDEMLFMVTRIVRAVQVPVTADLESGYGNVSETVRLAIEAGAAGCNIEDSDTTGGRGLVERAAQVDVIRGAREAASTAGVPLVINARTDVFLRGGGVPEQQLSESIERANAYLQAGADCAFVIGVRDAATIAALARGIEGPLNVIAGASTPTLPELERLGVARASFGSGPHCCALTAFQKLLQSIQEDASCGVLASNQVTYDEVNDLLRRQRRP